MRTTILAIGQKMPAWVDSAWDDYVKRFPADWKPTLKAIKAEPRTSGKTPAQMMAAEAIRLKTNIPTGARVIALDERGKNLSTMALAEKMAVWQSEGQGCVWLIGGPDGLAPEIKLSAHEMVKLSEMTLPHAMVRVLLIEQLYRAWSILNHHPYHRE